MDKHLVEKFSNIKSDLGLQRPIVHIPYSFSNIYLSESEQVELQTIVDKENGSESDKTINLDRSIRSKNFFTANKLNFIASSLINYAVKFGIGNIIIPNVDRSNNRLISLVKTLINAQIYSSIKCWSMFDNFSLTDLLRYLYVCKNFKDDKHSLIDVKRMDISLSATNPYGVTVQPSSKSSNDIIFAWGKIGRLEETLIESFIDAIKPSAAFLEANVQADKVWTGQDKINFIDNFTKIVESHVLGQKAI